MLGVLVAVLCVTSCFGQTTPSKSTGLTSLMFAYFDHLDKDHDGYIDMNEVKAVFTDSDIEGDHIIKRPEYEHDLHNKQLADFIFDYFDSQTKYGGTPNDGILEESLVMPYVKEVDTNHDNRISRFEYTSYATQLVMQMMFG